MLSLVLFSYQLLDLSFYINNIYIYIYIYYKDGFFFYKSVSYTN